MTYVKTLFKLFQVYFLLNGYMWLTCGNFVFSTWSRVWVWTFCRFQKCQFLHKCFKQKSILSKFLAQESLIQLIILIHLTIGLKLSLLFISPLARPLALEYTPKLLSYSISNVIWSKLQKLHLPILLLVMVQALLTGRTSCRSGF